MGISKTLAKMFIGRAFSTERGRITLLGKINYLLYPSHSLALTLQKIADDMGADFLFELGKEAGIDANKEQMEAMRIPIGGKRALEGVSSFLEFMGWGTLEIDDMKTVNGILKGKFTIRNNPVIEKAADVFGKKSRVCEFYRGVYTGHAGLIFGGKAAFKEKKCITRGDDCCEFVSG